jgi:hypothetical protein
MNGTNEHTPLGVGRKWLPFGGNRGPATAGSGMAVMMKALVPAFQFERKQLAKKKTALIDRAGQIRPEGQDVAWAQVLRV